MFTKKIWIRLTQVSDVAVNKRLEVTVRDLLLKKYQQVICRTFEKALIS